MAIKTLSASPSAPPAKRGIELLRDPALNKGTAFTRAERSLLGLEGLLPPHVSTMDEQVRRVLENVRGRGTDLERYVEMISLLDRNETLFYRVLLDHIEELMPVVYTPTVGAACQTYGHIFRRPRGIFLTRRDRGRIRDCLRHWPHAEVRVIVVTDGERILGLGDLGANGMGIPVGKLSLYTALGGVHPSETLPVMLDVGTNNEALLRDPLYLGEREPRLQGPEYDALVEELVDAVEEAYPGALLQFEDFANHNAFRLLGTYRDRACVFNDDIQGTAAVAAAGLLSALRATGGRLQDQTILFHGAGEAAIGIADLVVGAMAEAGMATTEARARCWFMDSKGLVVAARRDLDEQKRRYAHPRAPAVALADAVDALEPTALIGVSGRSGQFTRPVIEGMSRLNVRPIVFALSNPTANAECTAEQAYAWSEGRAIFASGSPFGPVSLGGRAYETSQANNAYVFPGVGLGVLVSGASRVTDEMFLEAARALAGLVDPSETARGLLFPAWSRIREVSARLGAAVAETAFRRGLAARARPRDVLSAVRASQYQPVYRDYR